MPLVERLGVIGIVEMNKDIFVYYQVPTVSAAALLPEVLAVQRSITRLTSVSASLKRRPEEKDGCQTWMEIYAQVPEDFLSTLDKAVTEAGLMHRIQGMRHTETFVDIAACA